MESLSCQLEDVCSDAALSNMREAMRAASDDLICLQLKCHQIVEHLDRHRQSLGTDSHQQMLTTNDGDMTLNKRFAIMATCSAEKVSLSYSVKVKGSPVLIGHI